MFALTVVMCFCMQTFVDCAETVVRAHVGSTVALPCRVDTDQCGALHSVKWYRDTSRIYVFSHVGSIARAEGDSTNRMTVEYSKASVDAKLKIEPVQIEDDATYKCEITYLEVREHCDVVQIVKLETLVKPEFIRIVDSSTGTTLHNKTTLDPMDEGSDLELICEARSGKPMPKVQWYNGTTVIKRAVNESTEEGNGLATGRSKLRLTLSKWDLLRQYKCVVESVALDESIVTWIRPDVHVRPANMEVYGVKGHVVQGTDIRLSCDVFGARPAAKVFWRNSSDIITNETLTKNSPEGTPYIVVNEIAEIDGTYTTRSILNFRVSRWENGKAFHCYAQNEVLEKNSEPLLHSLMVLEVQFPPVIKVNPPVITTNESSNILLLCHYYANPQKLEGVVWAKDGQNLTLIKDKYEGGSVDNPPLIINNVSRDDMGEYKCLLENSVGSQESEKSILLNVLFPPTVEVVMEPLTPVKEADKGNVTLVCNVTSGNPSTLVKVGWFLGDDLIKVLPECNYTAYDDTGNGEGSGGPLCEIDPSILSLERVDKSFAGNYTCQGRNAAGWGEESDPNELIVYYPPSLVKINYTPHNVIKDKPVNLTCEVGDTGRPENITYIWYRGTLRIEDVTTRKLVIPKVKSMDKNNYTCAAENAGGRSPNATVFLNVSAPPKFIQRFPTSFKGVLYNSKNISLTCRVECSPLCGIVWKKDEHLIDIYSDPLYRVEEKIYPPEIEKNDFESIESTLHWNMSAWPNQQLDKSQERYSQYVCQSTSNGVGDRVSSKIEIAVDYPPEELRTSEHLVKIEEGKAPKPVICNGRGRPALSYRWKRDNSTEIISQTAILELGAMDRFAAGNYICEASNKYGVEQVKVYFDVLYPPDCTIAETRVDGNLALVCTAYGNPSTVKFQWSLKDSNETLGHVFITQKDAKSYLILEADDSPKVYVCRANNSVGEGTSCEMRVDANIPWWKQLKWIIIIAGSLTLIVCFLVICIVIILYCRRKRSQTKCKFPYFKFVN